jgi:lysophospholipase L1-like esterase
MFHRTPNLRIARLLFVALFGLTAATACKQSPATPSDNGPTPGSPIVYTAIGASDVSGVGSSAPCLLTDCADGRGYVFVAARALRAQGAMVTVRNLGIPSAVISRSFEALGNQLGRTVVGNFIERQAPFADRESTVITIFAGANEVNIITSALGSGAGGTNPTAYIDAQVTTFASDFSQLLTTLRQRAPNARYVILNVPNVAGMPFLAGAPLAQRQAAQRASVRMTTTVVNPLAGAGVAIIDLMCEPRMYDRNNYYADGFHPNDTGYAIIGDLVARAISNRSYPAPSGSCAAMTMVP